MIEHLVVIGCSCGGLEAASWLMPRIELGDSALLISPHIHGMDIYRNLRKSKLAAHPIDLGTDRAIPIEPGIIYVLQSIGECWNYENKNAILVHELLTVKARSEGDWTVDYIMAMCAKAYSSDCIAVVLSGFGTDCVLGAGEVSRRGGRVLAQMEDCQSPRNDGYSMARYHPGMPKATMNAVNVDFAGRLDLLAIRLNEYLK